VLWFPCPSQKKAAGRLPGSLLERVKRSLKSNKRKAIVARFRCIFNPAGGGFGAARCRGELRLAARRYGRSEAPRGYFTVIIRGRAALRPLFASALIMIVVVLV
jgi:hypothetical protein